MTNSKFSRQLSEWLAAKKQRTLQDLIDKFKEKSFAILFLLLMAIPALPLPTGGVTHIFEIIVMLISLELIAGKRTVWLPKRWRKLHLPNNFQKSALPMLLKLIRHVEKYSRARLTKVLENALSLRLMGLIIFIFTLFAFLAPPFSGLDTLPALGVVIISLALIFEDLILAIAGLLIGIAGIGLIITLGKIVFKIF
jgi:hypothetical protein